MLLAFALRAMIPIGFTPADDGTLSLKICTEGFPAALPDAAAHGPAAASGAGRRVREDHCPFCGASTPAPGPISVVSACVAWVVIGTVALAAGACSLISLLHLPQARAPPAAP